VRLSLVKINQRENFTPIFDARASEIFNESVAREKLSQVSEGISGRRPI
jgi:hypothetical protein